MLNLRLLKLSTLLTKASHIGLRQFSTAFEGWHEVSDEGIIDLEDPLLKTKIIRNTTRGSIGSTLRLQQASQLYMPYNNTIEIEQDMIEGQQLALNEFSELQVVKSEPANAAPRMQKYQAKQPEPSLNTMSQQKIYKFSLATSEAEKKANTQQFVRTLGHFLGEKELRQAIYLIQKHVRGDKIKGKKPKNKSQKEEKMLFENIKKILLKSLQDAHAVRQLMKLFSESDPKLIKGEQIRKISDFHQSSTLIEQVQSNKSQFAYELKNLSKNQTADQFDDVIGSDSFLSSLSISNLTKQNSLSEEVIRSISSPVGPSRRSENSSSSGINDETFRLRIKKQVEKYQFKASSTNLEMVQKCIFGNKKLVTENIVIKKVPNSHNVKYNNYGENWVYAYDLPYSFTVQDAKQIVRVISSRYGPVEYFYGDSYENFVQKTEKEVVFVVPDDYSADENNQKVKIEKVKIARQPMNPKKASTTMRILEKARNQKNTSLNKSSMVFKFVNRQDKLNFLSPEMRLYGLNLPKFNNIKFEQAQSKIYVTVSMTSWTCTSKDLIKFLNEMLKPIKVGVSHPQCLITKGYVFVELSNFYQALQAKRILNNLIFQGLRIKAQLTYGSCHIINGEYKHNLQFDHSEQLMKRLNSIRQQKTPQTAPSIQQTLDELELQQV